MHKNHIIRLLILMNIQYCLLACEGHIKSCTELDFCVKVLLITNDQQSSLWTVIITGTEYVIHDTGS